MERYETDIREPREFKGNAIKDLNLAKVLRGGCPTPHH